MTRRAGWTFAGTTILANLLMVYALITKDFSVGYVAEVGSLSTPVHIAIVSLWASLNGSILFWAGVLGVYTAALIATMGDKHREYMPYTLHVLLGIAVFFTLLVSSIADPFAAVSPVPTDGPGPNPLLQNHWLMAVHPPTLYLGYVGMTVPFSMIALDSSLAGLKPAGWLLYAAGCLFHGARLPSGLFWADGGPTACLGGVATGRGTRLKTPPSIHG